MSANLLFGVGGPPVAHVRGMADEMTARIRPALLVLPVGVVCVLLIACANVANLFLSAALRVSASSPCAPAIGASRGRLARQLLTESLVLSSIGGALGLRSPGRWSRRRRHWCRKIFRGSMTFTLDGRTIVFTLAATLVTAILSGLAPALRGARFNLAESLHGGDGASAGGFRGAAGAATFAKACCSPNRPLPCC